MTIYNFFIVLIWLAFLGFWLVSAFGNKRSARPISWGGEIAFRFLIIFFAIIIFKNPSLKTLFIAQIVDYGNFNNPPLNGLGVVLASVGLFFAFWARVHLGKNWGPPRTVKNQPALITSGPYAYVRHPIYAGVLTIVLGSALVEGPVWFLLLVIVGVYFIYSAKVEENIMLNEFPDKYPEYLRKTKMLIPFIL